MTDDATIGLCADALASLFGECAITASSGIDMERALIEAKRSAQARIAAMVPADFTGTATAHFEDVQ